VSGTRARRPGPCANAAFVARAPIPDGSRTPSPGAGNGAAQCSSGPRMTQRAPQGPPQMAVLRARSVCAQRKCGAPRPPGGGGAPAAVRANSFPPPAAAAVGGRSPLVGTGAERPRCCHVAPLRGRSQHTLWACRRGEALRAHIMCPCSDLARRTRRGRVWRALCRAGARSEGRKAHCCPTGGIGARPRGARGVRSPETAS
jgi:hypothetical protein